MSRRLIPFICLIFVTAPVRADTDTTSDVMKAAREAQRMGDYHRAKDLLTQALSKAEVFDVSDSRRIEAKIQLAELLLDLGEYANCEQICTESIDAVKKQFGEKHLQIAEAERILARLYLQLGMSVLADQHCKRGLKIYKSIHTTPHPDVARFHAIMRQIWNRYTGGGNSGGANESLKFLEKSFGTSDPRLIALLEAIAGDCDDRWTPTNAARAVSLAEAHYGRRHPIYGRCLLTEATALRHIDDFEQAELLSKRSIEVLAAGFGSDSPQLSGAYRNLASIERHRGHSDRAVTLFRDAIRLRFCSLLDAELCHFFEQFLDANQAGSYGDELLDSFLTEMTRRGGGVIEQFLTKKIESFRQNHELTRKEFDDDASDEEERILRSMDVEVRMERYHRNLEFVTALCRIQRKPDPLQIIVEGSEELTCEFPELPAFQTTIRNVDSEKREIGFQQSGDYRSGRQARWRIEVRDAAGRVQPIEKLRGIMMGGGLFNPTTLEPGEGWETTLNMASFVEKLEPGEYQVRILYHNELTIVDWEFVAGLIVCRTEPIKLTVKRRSIEITKEQQQEVIELLKRFDDRQPRKIVESKYGEWAHKFIGPDSDYGRLLKLGWAAVPTLIDELVRDGQSPERRAHLLALLCSITGENNPGSPRFFELGENSALGTYSILNGGWSISSKRTGEDGPSSSGIGFVSGPTTHKGNLDAKKQAPFIERWQKFKSHCEVISIK